MLVDHADIRREGKALTSSGILFPAIFCLSPGTRDINRAASVRSTFRSAPSSLSFLSVSAVAVCKRHTAIPYEYIAFDHYHHPPGQRMNKGNIYHRGSPLPPVPSPSSIPDSDLHPTGRGAPLPSPRTTRGAGSDIGSGSPSLPCNTRSPSWAASARERDAPHQRGRTLPAGIV